MIISLDTETTGTDGFHGAKPFLVTTCTVEGPPLYWEWPVDPVTREPNIDGNDVKAIRKQLDEADLIVGQNLKFDALMLAHIGIKVPWHKVHDTLIAGHLLASNQPHTLDALVMLYLGFDIEPYELALKEAVLECRRVVQQARLKRKRRVTAVTKKGTLVAIEEDPLSDWRIAEKGLEEMPSAKETTWKYDTWLPKAMRNHGYFPDREEFDTALSMYATVDSEATAKLWPVMEAELKRLDLWEIYLESMKLPPILAEMQAHGVTLSKTRIEELESEYQKQVTEAGKVCVEIAAKHFGYDLKLPKGGNNKSLLTFCFGSAYDVHAGPLLNLPVIKWTDAGAPSLDKDVLAVYVDTLSGVQLDFAKALSAERKRKKDLTDLAAYRRYGCDHSSDKDTIVIHTNINQTGTDTLRMSSNDPNLQNPKKQKDEHGRSLRYCFGPAKGREWWSLDYENIELRIPAYESGEKELIAVFEKPDEPPFYGSYHLVVLSALWPKEWAEHGVKCKDLFKDTIYQWTKNFDFLMIYGGQRELADKTAHRPGAYDLMRERFPCIAALSDKWIAYANKHGYVETMPDKTVNPRRGYPLICSRTEYGKILPTVPLNYHIQSTAMQCTRKAQIRCAPQLKEWTLDDPRGYFMNLQIHDEIDFDFPAGGRRNLPKIQKLKRLMEQSGEDIGIPLKVSISFHPNNWSEAVKL